MVVNTEDKLQMSNLDSALHDFSDDDEPHKNAERYLNLDPVDIVNKHLTAVAFNEDGHLLLARSSLTGRIWNGSLNYFVDCEAAPDLTKASSTFRSQTGITDAKYAGNHRFLTAEDSGIMHFFTVEEQKDLSGAGDSPNQPVLKYQLDTRSTTWEHDDGVTSISIFPNKTNAVTGGRDMNILVWDMEAMMQRNTYRTAHSRKVTSVCARRHPSANDSVFSSCSTDRSAILWDTRKGKPASYLIKDAGCELTSVECHRANENLVAVGSALGDVLLVDVRDSRVPLSVLKCFDRPVFRLAFAEHLPDLVAVCGNNTEVKVYDCSTRVPSVIYSDKRHRDFVRGLDWNPVTHKLTSCGWDMQVLSHNVPSQSTSMDTK